MSLRSQIPAERLGDLAAFEALLRDPGVMRGMIARGDADRLAERHVDDSLRGIVSIPASARSLCDLGSGGGLPGVVLAIASPRVHVTLAERRRNRSTFLEMVVRELQLDNVSVFGGDARQLPAAAFDVCTARAFGDASATWAVAEPLLTVGGRLLYWAGSSFDVAAAVVPGARLRASEASEVAGSGPVVIMTRQ